MKNYLIEHQAEAFKDIAEAMGKKVKLYDGVMDGLDVVVLIPKDKFDDGDTKFFNPLTNAEQWIECLMWYHHRAWLRLGMSRLWMATASREALMIAILEMIDVDRC